MIASIVCHPANMLPPALCLLCSVIADIHGWRPRLPIDVDMVRSATSTVVSCGDGTLVLQAWWKAVKRKDSLVSRSALEELGGRDCSLCIGDKHGGWKIHERWRWQVNCVDSMHSRRPCLEGG